jgi:hypothetical protein
MCSLLFFRNRVTIANKNTPFEFPVATASIMFSVPRSDMVRQTRSLSRRPCRVWVTALCVRCRCPNCWQCVVIALSPKRRSLLLFPILSMSPKGAAAFWRTAGMSYLQVRLALARSAVRWPRPPRGAYVRSLRRFMWRKRRPGRSSTFEGSLKKQERLRNIGSGTLGIAANPPFTARGMESGYKQKRRQMWRYYCSSCPSSNHLVSSHATGLVRSRHFFSWFNGS